MTDLQVDALKRGDVILSKSGRPRVVREVSKRGRRIFVVATIQQCSWTGRCYTVLDRYQLKQYKVTGRRKRFRSELDREIQEEIANTGDAAITCCDVVGIP